MCRSPQRSPERESWVKAEETNRLTAGKAVAADLLAARRTLAAAPAFRVFGFAVMALVSWRADPAPAPGTAPATRIIHPDKPLIMIIFLSQEPAPVRFRSRRSCIVLRYGIQFDSKWAALLAVFELLGNPP
jgi:hypothetical protein